MPRVVSHNPDRFYEVEVEAAAAVRVGPQYIKGIRAQVASECRYPQPLHSKPRAPDAEVGVVECDVARARCV